MLTVVVNDDFCPDFWDFDLIKSIQSFKLWFVKFVLTKLPTKIVVSSENISHRIIPNFRDRLTSVCRGLKDLSAWMQYAAADVEYNSRPRTIPWLPGFQHSDGVPTLPWFGGHLGHLRGIIGKANKTTHDLMILCQMRTFGRALPPPGEKLLKEALHETIHVLTNIVKVPLEALNAVEAFAERLGRRLTVSQMPLQTHISMSCSGTLESSQREGGKAADSREEILKMSSVTFEETMVFDTILQKEVPLREFLSWLNILYDVYGQRILTSDWNNKVAPPDFGGLMFDGHQTKKGVFSLLDVLYTSPSEISARRPIKRMTELREVMPPNVGQALLAYAVGEAAKRGTWNNPPRGYIVGKSNELYIPIWDVPDQVIRYKPEKFPAVLVMSLAEPSCKARSLGKEETWFQHLGQAMRFMAEPIVARDGRARLGLESDSKLWDFLKWIQKGFKLKPGFVVQNTDRKSATDYLQFDYIRSLWTGFLKSLDPRHPFLVFKEIIWSPRELFPDPHLWGSMTCFQSKAGSLMGEPLSFLTLTLTSLINDDMTIYYGSLVSLKRLYQLPIVPFIGSNPTAIAGDDLTSIRLSSQFTAISRKISKDLGEVLSPSKDQDSRRIVLFCEDHAILTWDEQGNLTLLYLDVIKHRLLTKMSRLHSDNRVALLGKGQMLSRSLAYWETGPMKASVVRLYTNLLERTYPFLVGQTIHPIHLPPSCGGLGVPIDWDQLPLWELPYVRYVVWLTKQPKTRENVRAVLELQDLNSRQKYGIEIPRVPDGIIDELCQFSSEEISSDAFILEANKIYSVDQTRIIVESILGYQIPGVTANRVAYDILTREARNVGLIAFWDAIDLVERCLIFNEMLIREPKPPNVRSFAKWQRRSGKFWTMKRKIFNQVSSTDISAVKSTNDLNWAVLNYWGGFVLRERIYELLVRFGPTLQLNLRRSRATGSPMLRSGARELSINSIRERLGINTADGVTD